jgi:hypothetical protein
VALTFDEQLRAFVERGFRVEIVPTTREEWERLRPPAGFWHAPRCPFHVAILAGRVGRRRLRCVLCEPKELESGWWVWPVLLLGRVLKLDYRN